MFRGSRFGTKKDTCGADGRVTTLRVAGLARVVSGTETQGRGSFRGSLYRRARRGVSSRSSPTVGPFPVPPFFPLFSRVDGRDEGGVRDRLPTGDETVPVREESRKRLVCRDPCLSLAGTRSMWSVDPQVGALGLSDSGLFLCRNTGPYRREVQGKDVPPVSSPSPVNDRSVDDVEPATRLDAGPVPLSKRGSPVAEWVELGRSGQ